jgi:hypothetical protein
MGNSPTRIYVIALSTGVGGTCVMKALKATNDDVAKTVETIAQGA